jgi:hypothetical protein
MGAKSLTEPGGIDCQTCQANLGEYVRMELSGQDVDRVQPEMSFHIEICETCEAVYYREFRKQGQRKSIAELQQVGQRSEVAKTLQQIVWPVAPDPGWQEIAFDQGRAWLERETGRWRQLWLSLTDLGQTLAMGETLEGGLALEGLMQVTEPSIPVLSSMAIASPDGSFDLKLIVGPDPTAGGEALCLVEGAITLEERFGDFSGVRITLLWGDTSTVQKTDTLGKVSFTGLPCGQLVSMSMIVELPG